MPQAKRATTKKPPGLVVAVTGPTGEIGKPLLRALDRSRQVKEVRGMARRPFDPQAAGLKKVVYRQGDVCERTDVDALVKGADVVVHLAFIIIAGSDESRHINLEGSRNVFEAAVAAKAKRLVYASSVAAYGFHGDNDLPLTEDTPTRGSEAHPYSAMKAEVEDVLREVLHAAKTEAYVFRPCIVAGPHAPMLLSQLPYLRAADALPGAIRSLFEQVPILKPVLPDPGVAFQLVHHDDVAAALRAAVEGHGSPGIFNLAGPGELRVSDLADALGWYSVPMPDLAVDATAEVVARLPFLPDEARWVEAFRTPVLMSTMKARRELNWRPKHTAQDTLRAMVEAHRADVQAQGVGVEPPT